jgi:predicted AAA+ superfamily ATPase
LKGGYITTILGPRRVGKTSLVKHLTAQLKNIKLCELNLDALQIRERINKIELKQLIEENCLQKIGGKQKLWVTIDEAQKCPVLFDQIKAIYDEWKDTDKIKFVLTGSAHLSLHQLSAETLAGRIELFYLQPFTLREISRLDTKALTIKSLLNLISDTEPQQLPDILNNAIQELSPFKLLLQKNLRDSLIWGGLPEVATSEPNQGIKQRYLYNYIDTYLEQDIRKIETITDLNLYKNLMDIVAQQTGSLRDDTRILSVLGCGRDTLKKYRGYLLATLMYLEIFPYIGATLNKLVKSPKAYMLDNGIISNLTGIYDINVLINTGAIGHRFENWFLQELRAWLEQFSVRNEIYFLRLSSGTEIDFVVVKKPFVYPFEITYGMSVERKKMNNLTKFLQDSPNIPWGFYIYNGEFKVDHSKKIIFIPAWCI